MTMFKIKSKADQTTLKQYSSVIFFIGTVTLITVLFLVPEIDISFLPMSLLKSGNTDNSSLNLHSCMCLKRDDFKQAIKYIHPEYKNNYNGKLEITSNNSEEIDLKSGSNNLLIPKSTNYSQCCNGEMCSIDSLQTLSRKFIVNEVNCIAILSGNKTDVNEGIRQANATKRPLLSSRFYLNITENCEVFKSSRGYITCSMTQEEEEFPIAFSILVFKDIEMVERLLRAIYRPQNYYCIHVDAKANKEFFLAVSAVAQCFTNVFLTAERVDVRWGKFSVLEPELMCMKQLWRYTKWKYFINLTGQEFPLKTNAQMVKILTAFNGANDVEGTIKWAHKYRWPTKPPRGLRPVKGSVHVVVNRYFVDYILHNGTAKDLLRWVKGTGVPDETFFATLNHNPQLRIRGTYKGHPDSGHVIKPYLARFKNWGGIPCAGRSVRDICILSTGDLPLLFNTKQLFANKFYLWKDFISVGCLEEKLMNDTRDEFLGVKTFNVSYYESLGFLKNCVT
ncbi:beta-1,3-galactosyl-O-glycosyl-glycoprotein beta-1,6-N-acetylglucosaminyltransferase-like [Physella acuta]|uniref:beta-1,3-galactosyl-O-glycosyl-glycoprotein beta-1,6-N-acetylglucosaminyltransferase-like n=1 Tax=Physella acuta TaxID=109671 RepID=UPI0027DBE646|nr:beta-1,3-galactosyl-O-glycosyl-glycoprotein beta-1,6-N-acetylglucosaminyltransferase-like [Physella acuta]XP_059144078.1 beta-1,3-galactosyl-O-glycosyl-glycoprotein beta-1,6-N-acetylglucosaminyltransferase-like [Physella acuta]XP_059144079.1 beta-1,3-galactosyl-O-glycosyl-glycoprotein beta-1,6-N-acetylglucosaminyltransferase-like [Physella acuta]